MDLCQVVSTKETESDIDRACKNRNLIKPNCLFIKMHFLPLSLTNMYNYTSLYKFRLSMNCTNIFSNEKKEGHYIWIQRVPVYKYCNFYWYCFLYFENQYFIWKGQQQKQWENNKFIHIVHTNHDYKRCLNQTILHNSW